MVLVRRGNHDLNNAGFYGFTVGKRSCVPPSHKLSFWLLVRKFFAIIENGDIMYNNNIIGFVSKTTSQIQACFCIQ